MTNPLPKKKVVKAKAWAVLTSLEELKLANHIPTLCGSLETAHKIASKNEMFGDDIIIPHTSNQILHTYIKIIQPHVSKTFTLN